MERRDPSRKPFWLSRSQYPFHAGLPSYSKRKTALQQLGRGRKGLICSDALESCGPPPARSRAPGNHRSEDV